MISSLRALLQGNLQESWDECNNGGRLTPRTLDPGAGILSQEFRAPNVWWLHGAALGAQCSAGITSAVLQAVTFASLFRAKSTTWHHGEAHLIFNPPACEMWWWEMGDEGQGMLCHSTGAALHMLAEPDLSSAYPEHTLFLLSLLC